MIWQILTKTVHWTNAAVGLNEIAQIMLSQNGPLKETKERRHLASLGKVAIG